MPSVQNLGPHKSAWNWLKVRKRNGDQLMFFKFKNPAFSETKNTKDIKLISFYFAFKNQRKDEIVLATSTKSISTSIGISTSTFRPIN